MTLSAHVVSLPGGVRQDGAWWRDAQLREPSGEHEAALLDALEAGTMAERATTLLTACVTRLGAVAPPTADHVRSLTVGDREALLLHLRRLLVGERLECWLECPACTARMQLEASVGDFLVPLYPQPSERHELDVSLDGHQRRFTFRLPTGADQEVAARLAGEPDDRARLILHRCVLAADDLPDACAEPLAEAMAERDPQAEILLDAQCPECGERFTAPLDAAAFLIEELGRRARELDWEVHVLALRYGWSERDIVGMPVRRRRRFLGLLDSVDLEASA